MSNRATIHSKGVVIDFHPYSNCSMGYAITAQVLQNAIDNDQVVLIKSSLNSGTDVYGFTPKGRSVLKQLKTRFGL